MDLAEKNGSSLDKGHYFVLAPLGGIERRLHALTMSLRMN